MKTRVKLSSKTFRKTNKNQSIFRIFQIILITSILIMLILVAYFFSNISQITKINLRREILVSNSTSNESGQEEAKTNSFARSFRNEEAGSLEILSWDQIDGFTFDEFAKYMKEVKTSSFYADNPKETLPLQTKGIIIFTNYRSGSSFLGQLFNQHEDLFYIFEPLFPLTPKCKTHVPAKVKLLHRLLKCDFPSVIDTYKQANITPEDTRIVHLCLKNDFCFRDKTVELESEELCKPLTVSECKKLPINLAMAMNLCRKKKMTVIKSLRLCDMSETESIFADPDMDVKIIHLIRDPRGMESSRLKLKKDWPYLLRSNQTCSRLLSNGLFGRENSMKGKWLHKRYKAVRYEDLASKPFEIAEKLYSFVGVNFTSSVQKWIKTNVYQSLKGKRKKPFSTKRNSNLTLQAWRNHLTLDQVLKIQNICSEMMKFFGYKPVTTEADLKDLRINLFN